MLHGSGLFECGKRKAIGSVESPRACINYMAGAFSRCQPQPNAAWQEDPITNSQEEQGLEAPATTNPCHDKPLP
jgi:hypothetical protein